MRRLSRAWVGIVGWASLGASCAAELPRAEVEVHAVDGRGEPVAGVEVRVDGQLGGRTDDEGALRVGWPGERRGRVEIRVDCGDAFDSPPPRRLRARTQGALRLEMTCAAVEHRAWLAILAPGGQGLPVRVDGEPVAEIDASGGVHAEVVRAADSEIQVRIDTSQHPELRPQNPVVRATLDRDRLVVMQQPFERARPPRRASGRHLPVSRPRRLRSL